MQIDFHSHILPHCDHGSRSLNTSLKQVEMAREAGVDLICATPHFYPHRDRLEDFLARRAETAQRLKGALEGVEHPEILVGSEVLLCERLDALEGVEQLCLEGTNIILLELPYNTVSDEAVETVRRFHESGRFKVVLAHIDRYDKSVIEKFLPMGVSAQINVETLSKTFAPSHVKTWVKEEDVVAWGSDIHGTDIGYKRWLKVKKRMGSQWDVIMERTEKLIKGQ